MSFLTFSSFSPFIFSSCLYIFIFLRPGNNYFHNLFFLIEFFLSVHVLSLPWFSLDPQSRALEAIRFISRIIWTHFWTFKRSLMFSSHQFIALNVILTIFISLLNSTGGKKKVCVCVWLTLLGMELFQQAGSGDNEQNSQAICDKHSVYVTNKFLSFYAPEIWSLCYFNIT